LSVLRQRSVARSPASSRCSSHFGRPRPNINQGQRGGTLSCEPNCPGPRDLLPSPEPSEIIMSTTPERAMNDAELQLAASTLVGQLVFEFSRIDMELGCSLHTVVNPRDIDALNVLIDRLSFKSKLDALNEVVARIFEGKEEFLAEFKHCYRSIDAIRSRRNSFIHGRWGAIANTQQVVHVESGMPGGVPQREWRFTIAELKAELASVSKVLNEFRALRAKWYL
jgi:hypothetical protein